MRLAFVTPEYPTESSGVGGLAWYVRRTARALATRGHAVHVLVHASRPGEYDDAGVTVHRVPASGWARAADRISLGRVEELLLNADFSRTACDALERLHAGPGLDLVQFPNLHGFGHRTLRRLDVPHVVRLSHLQSLVNRHMGALGPGPLLATLPEGRYLRAARHLIAPSASLAREARRRGLDVTVIPSPAWCETAQRDDRPLRALGGRPFALFFGRFELGKGFHVLADALPALFRAEPDAIAVLVGRDVATRRALSMKRYLLRRCGGFEDRVVVLPPQGHDALYPLVAAARVVVLPSLVENLSNAVLEAVTLNGCVVATRDTSAEEIIEHGVSGRLVAPGDAPALARAMVDAWRDPDRAAMVQAATVRAAAFHPDIVIPRLEAYYRTVVG